MSLYLFDRLSVYLFVVCLVALQYLGTFKQSPFYIYLSVRPEAFVFVCLIVSILVCCLLGSSANLGTFKPSPFYIYLSVRPSASVFVCLIVRILVCCLLGGSTIFGNLQDVSSIAYSKVICLSVRMPVYLFV